MGPLIPTFLKILYTSDVMNALSVNKSLSRDFDTEHAHRSFTSNNRLDILKFSSAVKPIRFE